MSTQAGVHSALTCITQGTLSYWQAVAHRDVEWECAVGDLDHVVDQPPRYHARRGLGVLPAAVGTHERTEERVEDDQQQVEDGPGGDEAEQVGGEGAGVAGPKEPGLAPHHALEHRAEQQMREGAVVGLHASARKKILLSSLSPLTEGGGGGGGGMA